MKHGKFDRDMLRGFPRKLRHVLAQMMETIERDTNVVGFTPIDTIDSALGKAFTVDQSDLISTVDFLTSMEPTPPDPNTSSNSFTKFVAKAQNVGGAQDVLTGATTAMTHSTLNAHNTSGIAASDKFTITSTGWWHVDYEIHGDQTYAGAATLGPATVESWVELNGASVVVGTQDCDEMALVAGLGSGTISSPTTAAFDDFCLGRATDEWFTKGDTLKLQVKNNTSVTATARSVSFNVHKIMNGVDY